MTIKEIQLKSIDPTISRSRGLIDGVSDYFSEFATMKYRVELEIEWLIFISKLLGKEIGKKKGKELQSIIENFDIKDAQWIENKDLEINHDTKSAEYFIRMKLEKFRLEKYSPLVHIGLTSADIDNNAVMLSIQRFEKEYFSDVRKELLIFLKKFIKDNRDSLFIAKTHGKYAVPSTMSKEFANYYHRLEKLDKKLKGFKFEGKISGAVGNWNALYDSYPEIDWVSSIREFIKSIGLVPNMFNTQILPYENLIEYLHLVHQYNYVLIDMAKDMWTYISEGYFKLHIKKEEVGSSTMSHKVNPISFERCESNLIVASGIIEILSRNLPINRLQRDLTDKHIVRELGPIMARCILGYKSLYGGITHVDFNKEFALEELNNHWEILSEAMQTILREHGYQDAYEVIKDKTRGKTLTEDEYMEIVSSLDISEEARDQLKELRPEEYIGWARDIVKLI